jgi:hypothetical protein
MSWFTGPGRRAATEDSSLDAVAGRAEFVISEPTWVRKRSLSLASLIASQPDSKGCVHDDPLENPAADAGEVVVLQLQLLD